MQICFLIADLRVWCYDGWRGCVAALAVRRRRGGALFETAVLLEVVKTLVHRGEEPRVTYWRTAAGSEVDLLVETGGRVIARETRLSATPRPAMAAGIRALRSDQGDRIAAGYVVHPGDVRLPLAPGVASLPFAEL